MVDLADRGEREALLARKLGRAMGEARKLLLQAVEDGVVTDDEWRAIAQTFQAAIQVELETTALAAGLEAAEALGIGIDPAALHARAIEWARQYSFELVSKLDQRNRALLQQTIGDYFANGLSLSDVEARLTQAFGPVRAQIIAVTETTRASSEGRQAFARELEQMGLKPVVIWKTANDEIAGSCPICGPRNNRPIDEVGGAPPGHPNCRCTTSIELRGGTR